MEENTAAVIQPERIFTDVIRAELAEIPEYKYNLKALRETLGVHKGELLRAYASGEIAQLRSLCEWLELTFPEDCRTAIIRHGQERLALEIESLRYALAALIAELQIVTKHGK